MENLGHNGQDTANGLSLIHISDLFVQEDRKVMEDMLRGRTGSGEDKIQYAELRLKSCLLYTSRCV